MAVLLVPANFLTNTLVTSFIITGCIFDLNKFRAAATNVILVQFEAMLIQNISYRMQQMSTE